ncbi:hypothetical protein MFIFM68171_10160 [Madurella fahalii]|uniref:Uncharacterized protein n=1 Tax=Madurella fahalii TaxID=1157608 RepID=A0ABQ0GQC3_9PEZI
MRSPSASPRRLGCGAGYPGHGDLIKDLPRVLDMYIAQRDARERQVCAVLALDQRLTASTVNGLTVEDVEARLYGEVAGSADGFDTARKSLLDQVLYMLADHGKVGSRLVGSSQTRHWTELLAKIIRQWTAAVAPHPFVVHHSRQHRQASRKGQQQPGEQSYPGGRRLQPRASQRRLARPAAQAPPTRQASPAWPPRGLPAGVRRGPEAGGAVPPFDDVVTLGSRWETLRRGPVGGAWEGAMVCLYQLAVLISHHEASNQPYRNEDFAAPYLAGISIGLFLASAVAVSPTLVDLVSCGAEGVRMAFVFCRHVGCVSQLLETSTRPSKDTTSSPSWASVIIGLISHVDHASVGVTGPAARLAELFRKSRTLGASRHAALPISRGFCHVPHVYNDDDDDVRAVRRAARVWERWDCRPVRQPLLSPHTGARFEAANAAGLIETICAEALTKPLFLDKVAEGAVAQISHSLASYANRRRVSAAVQAACSALRAGEANTVVAGGLNIITSPDIYCMLCKSHFLSPTG